MNAPTPAFSLPVLAADVAPEASRPLLAAAKAKFGFVPNLLSMMAHSPALLEGYLTLAGIFDKTSLSPTERQVVLLAVSFENGCDYCMVAHSAIAAMQKVDGAVVQALRTGKPIADERLEALRRLAASLVRTRGFPEDSVIQAFLAAGWKAAQAQEVVLGVGVKTLSNYANHIAATPLDAGFAPAKWSPPGTVECGCDR